MSIRILALVCSVALLTAFGSAGAPVVGSAGPRLGVRGDRFTIDGADRFLVFVSYFHGLDRPAATLASDLDWFRSKGINGIRVWPNVSEPPLVQASGQLDAGMLHRLSALVGSAAARGLVVDVTFTREHVDRDGALGVPAYADAIAAVASALRPFGNVLFDLQNEWNCPRAGPGVLAADLTRIRAAVARKNAAAIVTASVSCGPYLPAPSEVFDVLAYHGPRDAAGGWASETGTRVRALRSHLARSGGDAVPIYLQEPNRFAVASDRESYYDNDPAHYVMALARARQSGAAAWTFHTAAGFDLASATSFANLLLPGERQAVERMYANGASGAGWP